MLTLFGKAVGLLATLGCFVQEFPKNTGLDY